jgi:hypothetical protein
VNLDAIAKRVTHKETFPRRWSSIVSLYACCLQLGSQAIHIGAFNAKVPLRVCSRMLLIDRYVNIKSAGVKPDAASNSKRLGLRNLP